MSQQINLYNVAFVPKRPLLTAPNLALAALAVYGTLFAAGSWAYLNANKKAQAASVAQVQLKQAQEKFDIAKRASEARKPSPALQAEIDRLAALISMRDEVLAVLKQGMSGDGKAGAGFSSYLTGLSRQTRDGLWLTGFAVAADGSGMVLRGRTLDKSLLPDYVRRLNNEVAFSGKSFAGMQMDYREVQRMGDVKTTAVAPVASTKPADTAPTRYLEFQLMAENLAAPTEARP